MLQDFLFGIRMLRRSPGFSILAILCLTLGIGATTSVFSWIEGILLRPFPLVAAQDRLVAVGGLNHGNRTSVSWPDFQDLKKYCTLIDTVIADRIMGGSTITITRSVTATTATAGTYTITKSGVSSQQAVP